MAAISSSAEADGAEKSAPSAGRESPRKSLCRRTLPVPGKSSRAAAVLTGQQSGCRRERRNGDELRRRPGTNDASVRIGANDLDQIPQHAVTKSEGCQCLSRHSLMPTNGEDQEQEGNTRQ